MGAFAPNANRQTTSESSKMVTRNVGTAQRDCDRSSWLSWHFQWKTRFFFPIKIYHNAFFKCVSYSNLIQNYNLHYSIEIIIIRFLFSYICIHAQRCFQICTQMYTYTVYMYACTTYAQNFLSTPGSTLTLT